MKAAWKTSDNILGIIVVIATIVFAGCGDQSRKHLDSDYELSAASFDAAHLKMIESKTGLVLPPGSEGCNLLWRGQQIDPSFRAKILITNDSANAFVEQIKGLPNQKISVVAPKVPSLAWWQPFKGTVAVERTFIQAGCYVHLVICKEGEAWFLFLEWISA